MGFDALPGNQRLKENLAAALKQNRISHGYLICGPEGSGKQTLANLLAAAAVCRGADRPCCACSDCRKVLSGLHPDVITVDDPEKKTVSVDLVRQARADMYVRPNEAERKVYIFPRAQDMRTEAQNALLKVLEEPPAYGMFLLLADMPEKLLPTIRSRCVELKLQEQPDEPLTEGRQASEHTARFCRAYAAADQMEMLSVLTSMEKWKREELVDALNQWQGVFVGALSCKAGIPSEDPLSRQISTRRSGAQLHSAVDALKKAASYAQSNVSVAAICSWLSWELK